MHINQLIFSLINNLPTVTLFYFIIVITVRVCFNVILRPTELLYLFVIHSIVYIGSILLFNIFYSSLVIIPIFLILKMKKNYINIIKLSIIPLYVIVLFKIAEFISIILYVFFTLELATVNILSEAFFIVLFVLSVNKINIFLENKLSYLNNSKYHKLLILSIYIMIITYNIIISHSFENKHLYVLAAAIIIVFGVYCLYLLIVLVKNILLEKQNALELEKLEQQKKYILALEKNNNEIRKFKHDFNNIILGLDGYINNDDFDKEKLKKYFNSTIINYNNNIKLNNIVIAKLNSIKVNSLKSLITNKVLVAQNNNIDVDINIEGEITDFYTDEMQLSRILGILLDNAIEASLELTHDKKIEMNIIQIDKTTDIQISNTFNNTGTPITDFNKEGFSTKGTNRGLGLSSAHEIANKLNILLNTEIDGNTFIQTITIETNISY